VSEFKSMVEYRDGKWMPKRDAIDVASEERSFAPVDTPGKWQQGMVWQGATGIGNVSSDQAMRLSAVFACLRLLSEAVATLPLDTYIREGGVRRPYRPVPDYLSFDPPQGSRIDYLSQVMLSLLTDGNAYIYTPRNRLGVPVDLVVLDPARVLVGRVDGRVKYLCNNVELDASLGGGGEIIHIKGMCLPGDITGMSPIAYARETIGLGLAAQRFGESFFANGALPGAVIEADGNFSQEAAERFAAAWNARHQGISNANKVGVLTGGAKLTKISVAPNDAQFLETRAFQVPDVARIFGVPPHLIADASNSTSWGSGLAEQNLAFGQFSLRPWIDRIEDAHDRLLTSHGLRQVFARLNLDALLRASLKDRYAAYAVGIDNRVITAEEARALEDLAPLPARVDKGDIESVGALIRAGFDPTDALRVLGLPPIKHTGSLPITVQPTEETP
jgi:HK97 family phage portal protein